jgi:FkbM family methyltransferase
MTQDTCIVSANSHKFLVGHSNQTELMRANSFTHKEPETVQWLIDELHAESVFWDIGANIGLFSLYAAAIHPTSKILAFEPAAHNYASLCENILINKFENIRPYSIALGMDQICFVDLYLSKMEAGSAIHNIGKSSPWSISDSVFKQPCVSVSIDELIEKHGFPQPTIIKIDVDGAEISILKTASTALKNVNTLLVELDAHDEVELGIAREILEGHGFRLFDSSKREKTINRKLPRNYIWKK